jgi:hypothetical protein
VAHPRVVISILNWKGWQDTLSTPALEAAQNCGILSE